MYTIYSSTGALGEGKIIYCVSYYCHFKTIIAQLDSDSLVIEITGKNSIIVISWDNPTNTLSSSFTYVVSVVLVTTGETIDQQTVVVTKESAPSAKFYSLEQYTCDKLNFSIHIFNTVGSIWSIITLPECKKNVL